MNNVTVTITEEERQMLLLALAKLSLERPGWHWALSSLAVKYSLVVSSEDGRAMFEQFRDLHRPEAEGAPEPEVCICAAVLTEEGLVIRGHRHHDALRAASLAFCTPKRGEDAQGFITSRNRYVTARRVTSSKSPPVTSP